METDVGLFHFFFLFKKSVYIFLYREKYKYFCSIFLNTII